MGQALLISCSMHHSFEIRFDQVTEKAIWTIWEDASEMYGTDYVLKNGVIPHMALLVGDERLGELFAGLDCPNCEIELRDIGFFAKGKVAYVNCNIPEEVSKFHRRAYDRAISIGATIDPLYSPDNWHPHSTIAQNCTRNLMNPVSFPPLIARSHSLIHVIYPPTQLIEENVLTAQQSSS